MIISQHKIQNHNPYQTIDTNANQNCKSFQNHYFISYFHELLFYTNQPILFGIKLMISTNIPEPDMNFWENLVTKVQQIGERSREKAPMPHIPGQISIRKHRFSRFQAEQLWHREQEETLQLSNRLKYIQIDKQRQNRTLDLTRRKYERMMQIRQKSLKQKQELQRRIIEANQQTSKQAALRVSRMKQERTRTSHSVQRVKAKNEQQAKSIRELTEQLQQIIKQDRQMQVEHKKVQVERTKEMIEKSRMKLSQIQQQRVNLGKVEHKETIKRQLQINLQQHRKNSLLRHKLQESIVNANNSKQQRFDLLQEYRTVIAPSPNHSRIRQLSSIQSN